jgi:hypothetical protein
MASENYNIDFSVLEKSEKFKPEGYVPVCTAASIKNKNPVCSGKSVGDAIGKSGVTIGTGVDLGQMNEYDLKRLKLPDYFYKTLKPYLGKRGTAALKMPKLQLMGIDAKILSYRVKDKIISIIVKRYEEKSGKVFNSLSNNIQTAIIDYFYQYGQNSMLIAPHKDLWEYITDNNWEKVVQFLDTQEQYKDRRKREADFIRNSTEYSLQNRIP